MSKQPNVLVESVRQQLAARTASTPTITPMSGATSSDLFLLDYPDQREVLRIFKAERWDTPAAELSQRELQILSAVANAAFPTPAPIEAFADNGVIMSWLPGSVVLPANPADDWLVELAQKLADIHSSQASVPFQFESWNDTAGTDCPDWWQSQTLWRDALAAAANPPGYEPTFIHRDYHPVNVLWDGARITGIVDWINACMGPVGIDLAHCRVNLAVMYGQETAEAFLAHYQTVRPDYQHDAYWDLDDALGALPDVRVYAPWVEFGLTGLTDEMVRLRLEGFIEAALRSL